MKNILVAMTALSVLALTGTGAAADHRRDGNSETRSERTCTTDRCARRQERREARTDRREARRDARKERRETRREIRREKRREKRREHLQDARERHWARRDGRFRGHSDFHRHDRRFDAKRGFRQGRKFRNRAHSHGFHHIYNGGFDRRPVHSPRRIVRKPHDGRSIFSSTPRRFFLQPSPFGGGFHR